MRIKRWPGYPIALFAVVLGSYAQTGGAESHAGSGRRGQLAISRAEYQDRARAIWTAQMIGQWTGRLFGHKGASVLKDTPLRASKGYASVDDEYYDERGAVRAFEKYRILPNVQRMGPRAR